MRPRAKRTAAFQPAIYITETDHRHLSSLVSSSVSASPGGGLLQEELDRAIIVIAGEAPRRFAQLNSRVTYEDASTGTVRTVQLVLPDAADIDENRISVLTPVGAALIGLTVGQKFAMGAETGRARTVHILKVEHDRK